MSRKVWNEIAYPFPNLNDYTVDVWEGISNFIPHFIKDVQTSACWDLSWSMWVKGGSWSKGRIPIFYLNYMKMED